MMPRSAVVGIWTLLIALGAEGQALAQQQASPCDAVREHTRDTVIVFQPPSTFTICRDGSVESGAVTDRSVYLELVPTPGPRMFDFRVRGNPSDWSPAGLGAWEALTSKIAGKLRDLDHSGEPIADLVVPLDPPSTSVAPLRPLAAARTRYLADVTPRYLEALHSVRADARELPVVAGVVRRWCSALAPEAPGALSAETEVRALCASPEVREGAVERVLAEFESAADKERAESSRARDAALAALAHPDDAKGVADAVHALDDARAAANAVVAAAHALRESSHVLARDVATLHIALRSLDTIRPGVPVYLSTYATPGNAELEIETSPSDISAVGTDLAHGTRGKATARFPIFGRHYLDIEAGLGWTAGVPQSPYVTNIQGNQVIQSKPVDEFVGLALVELEALRFLWPERPLAGLLRFPVVGIPFTRDPTSNFFVGAGLGWTGVGSVSAGPYLLRETTLRQGFAADQILPPGVPFGATTVAGVRTGYFVSASVDLVGLFHLVVPNRVPTIDASTGKEK
jgi:hypothetical protein